MSGQGRILSNATWLRDVHDAQEGARAFRAAHQMDLPKQQAKRDFFVTTVRIWRITILFLVIGVLVAVILEKLEAKHLSPPSSSQIARPEK
ncbi:MAG: hypothetical protein ACXWJ5_13800 [Xanthobacteraceae bacterium]